MSGAYCPKCGKERTGDRFCGNCGFDFAEPSPSTASAAPAAQPAGRQQNNTAVGCGALLAVFGIIWIFSQVSGRSGSTSNNTGSDSSTPKPAYAVSVDSAKFTTETSVGGSIFVTVQLSNSGSSSSPATQFQFGDIGDYADLVGCTPKCETSDFLGQYATLPGVPAHGEASYVVEFLAKAVGAPTWSLAVYDRDDGDGEQIYYGEGTTKIR